MWGEIRWAPQPACRIRGEDDAESALKIGRELSHPGLEGRILGRGNDYKSEDRSKGLASGLKRLE